MFNTIRLPNRTRWAKPSGRLAPSRNSKLRPRSNPLPFQRQPTKTILFKTHQARRLFRNRILGQRPRDRPRTTKIRNQFSPVVQLRRLGRKLPRRIQQARPNVHDKPMGQRHLQKRLHRRKQNSPDAHRSRPRPLQKNKQTRT